MEIDARSSYCSNETETKVASVTARRRPTQDTKKVNGDYVFRCLTTLFALSILAILALMIYEMTGESMPAIKAFGWKFVSSREWDAVQGNFGALPYLYGSVVSSVLALLLATPLSIGAALFITEVAPGRMGAIVAPLVELLAAIPSVIYGLWGVLVMAPWLQSTVQPFLIEHFGFIPLFQGAPYGVSMLAAIFILMIMVVPIITSITREVLLAVPQSQKEAAIALGATRWETIKIAILPYGKSGILGAAILGLGRAIGETMAVTMVIGNAPNISLSLLSPAYTMPSVIANEFAETTSKLHASALMEIGLILMVVTLVVNALARLLIWSVSRSAKGGAA
ncbi:phosphate ABC transporter permease subunit PstC [Geomonas azotofigens]|uniref:phosphate ABC transporter permease subunit PstC n=1 Tax=Geomonas azotofigens TaxID=2843196 RepID=UPI001C11DDB6|nr:phosphate ABC transporter permease subunit PstC [Geomonas azotofigens]MBU5612852.1 phosphate ABC transporter permease subunit PstC [Geomonas azotofigens]